MIFLPIIDAGYAKIDDWVMLRTSETKALQKISLKYIAQTFSTYHEGLYHPIVTLAYCIEKQIFGLNPAFFHFDSILLHLFNVILVFIIFFKLSKSFWLSFIITALFAIHPTRVEVVAWISARKDLIYSMFYLLSIFFYIKTYDGYRKKTYIAISMIMFLLSCFSKSMAITLPFVLILIDLYTNNYSKNKIKIYISFIAITAIFIIPTIDAHYIDYQYFKFSTFTSFVRFIEAHFNILFYFDKLVFPVKLYCMYPYFYSEHTMMPNFILYSPAVLYLIIFAVFFTLKKTKVIFYGFMFFLITMLPVCGVLPVGDFSVADRYTYIPYLGLFFIIAKFIAYIYNKNEIIFFKYKIKNCSKYLKTFVILICLTVFTIFCYLSYRRTVVWQKNAYAAPISMKCYKFGIVKDMW